MKHDILKPTYSLWSHKTEEKNELSVFLLQTAIKKKLRKNVYLRLINTICNRIIKIYDIFKMMGIAVTITVMETLKANKFQKACITQRAKVKLHFCLSTTTPQKDVLPMDIKFQEFLISCLHGGK
jgi:hypothetical protein